MAINMADKLRTPFAALLSSPASESPDKDGSYTSVWSNLGKRTMMRVASVGSTFGNPSSMSNQAPESFLNCKRGNVHILHTHGHVISGINLMTESVLSK